MALRLMRRCVFSVFWLTLAAPSAQATIAREFYRGAGPLAMGNTGVALADDENAVFYNPAGVAGFDSMTLHLLKVDLATSGDVLTAKDSIQTLKDPDGASLNSLMGKNLYLQGRGSSFLTLPNVGIGAFYDAEGSLYPVNQAFPKISFGYQRTSAVQVAVGFSSSDRKIAMKRGRGRKDSSIRESEWRFGAAAKYVRREGGIRTIPISQLVTLSTKDDVLNLMGQPGSGYGIDFGVQRVQRFDERTTFFFGAAATNLGDIAIGNGSDSVKSIVSAGVAASRDVGVGTISVAYDLRHLTREDDWRKRQHFGARFAFPVLLDLYAGMNQTFLTYGAGVDLLLFKVNAVAYKEEVGSFVQQNPERRYQLSLEVKFPL